MFDIGFWELSVLGVVALLVIGPERLPGVARTVGAWVGRGKRFISSVKADIDQELRTDELKRILENQKTLNPMHEIMEETTESLKEVGRETTKTLNEAKKEHESVSSHSESESKST
ncbi:MAG TPA: twin-arginine translocase subunit TatB [Gammaproteobacteria bacterium]|nr:twin-arginine translocase subunit TatB [Gammaproteobacteria bacterium]